jgi:bifunctional pyridoxal-dependent enzyme with beta-cystathionase and maltose regulon repressor activities
MFGITTRTRAAEIKGHIVTQITGYVTKQEKLSQDVEQWMKYQSKIATLHDLLETVNENFNLK